MEGRPAVVVAATVGSEGMKVYEVDDTKAMHTVSVEEVGNFLSSHTRLLRVTSSLPAHINPHHTTRGIKIGNTPPVIM